MSNIQKPSKKIIIILVVAILIAATVAAYFFIQKRNNSEQTKPPVSAGGINLDPPTAEDAQRVDQNKQEIIEREEKLKNTTPQTDNKKSVTPIITYASQYSNGIEVGGYVNGVLEDNGTCTATFKNGTASLTKSVTAIRNNSSVDCPVISASADEFKPKGTWNVSLSYSSPTATGASENKSIEIK